MLNNSKTITLSGGQTDDDQSYTRFSEDDIKDALLVSQTCPGILSGPNAQVLVSLLTHPDSKLQDAARNLSILIFLSSFFCW
jgi:hypothetical protein